MTYTLATPANMRAYEQAHPVKQVKQSDGSTVTIMPARIVALSLFTGEEYSASSGDYWQRADNEPLRDSDGEPMVLAVPFSGYRDAVTGEEL